MRTKLTIHAGRGTRTLEREAQLENVIRLAATLYSSAHQHYQRAGLQYVDVPQIVGITGACENVDTLFKIGNRQALPLFMTQTGQLALEQALQRFSGVYTMIHSGRDEELEDERHLRQFRLTEEEFDWTMVAAKNATYDEARMYEALLQHIESAAKATICALLQEHGTMLKKIYGRNVRELSKALDYPFLRITYADAIRLLNAQGEPALQFGADLVAEQEQKIVRVLNEQARAENPHLPSEDRPVFIMRYPEEIKFFNMKVSQADSRVVLSADLILPYSGEAVGSAVREHDGQKLKERLLGSTMFKLHRARGGSYRDFTWYVEDIIRAGRTQPHAGYGLGNERLLQFIMGQRDIRLCSVFSLMAEQTKDWDTNRRGQSLMIAHQKAVLLSIGKSQNKRKLLPSLQKIAEDGFVLYATEKTHHFLQRHDIRSTLVHKISQPGRPNLKDLLGQNLFDLIVNIPTRNPRRARGESREFTDGRLIRQTALDSGTTLITDVEVAQDLFEKLAARVASKG